MKSTLFSSMEDVGVDPGIPIQHENLLIHFGKIEQRGKILNLLVLGVFWTLLRKSFDIMATAVRASMEKFVQKIQLKQKRIL